MESRKAERPSEEAPAAPEEERRDRFVGLGRRWPHILVALVIASLSLAWFVLLGWLALRAYHAL